MTHKEIKYKTSLIIKGKKYALTNTVKTCKHGDCIIECLGFERCGNYIDSSKFTLIQNCRTKDHSIICFQCDQEMRN